ncbi:hypothetical protein BJ546DRAFT_971627 [Cryomyces antarcticus]
MASRILLPRVSPLTLGLFTSSSLLAAHTLLQPNRYRLLCDTSLAPAAASSKDWSFSQYQAQARTPVVKDGRLNANAVRQVSAGSIMGLVGGLAVSLFSKPLALLIGILVFGIQFAESRGIHMVPYKSMQKYFTSIDLRSAVQDNVAFKLSFGATFALAAFAEF